MVCGDDEVEELKFHEVVDGGNNYTKHIDVIAL